MSAACLATIGGCASTGPREVRPAPGPTASIAAADVLIDSIDGTNVRRGVVEARTRFDIAPGRHEIGISRHLFTPGAGLRGVKSTYATVCLQAAVGRAYLVRPLVQADGSWMAVMFDTATNTQVATTCAAPEEPIVAHDGVADGTRPAVDPAAAAAIPAPAVAATSATVGDERPDRPGTGLALRAGWALGGEALVGARLENGNEVDLDAGAGRTVAVAGSITPFWLRRRLGLGGGLELGWKYNAISAANGSASFSRFPFLATVHVLARAGRHWYAKLGVGIEKHFACHYSSQGIFGEADIALQGRTGPVGGIGLYRLFGRHGGVDVSFRYSRARFGLGAESIDGTSGAIMLALHYVI